MSGFANVPNNYIDLDDFCPVDYVTFWILKIGLSEVDLWHFSFRKVANKFTFLVHLNFYFSRKSGKSVNSSPVGKFFNHDLHLICTLDYLGHASSSCIPMWEHGWSNFHKGPVWSKMRRWWWTSSYQGIPALMMTHTLLKSIRIIGPYFTWSPI